MHESVVWIQKKGKPRKKLVGVDQEFRSLWIKECGKLIGTIDNEILFTRLCLAEFITHLVAR